MIVATCPIHLDSRQVSEGEYKLYCPFAHNFIWSQDYSEVDIVPVEDEPLFYDDEESYEVPEGVGPFLSDSYAPDYGCDF